MSYHLHNIKSLDDEGIHKMLNECNNINNKNVVLHLLVLANKRFDEDLPYQRIRGASYLTAASVIAYDFRDVRHLSKADLMILNGIGDRISDEMIHFFQLLMY